MEENARADAKLKGLPRSVRDTLWRMRNPMEEEDKKFTYIEILAWLEGEHGVKSSLASLSEYYGWERMCRRMESAAARANQAKLELARDPDISPEDLERVAQTVFTAETIEAGNVKAYVALAKLGLQRRALEIDHRKLELLEAKAKRLDELEAKAREITTGGGLSAETLEVIEKQLKLL